MSKLASEVVKQCKAWLGYNEADGSHKVIIDTYNSHKPLARGYKMKYTDAWCSCFVSAVAIKLGYTDIIPTEVGCEKHVELFENLGIWIEDDSYTPKDGDIILYDWDDNGVGDNRGSSDHIGYVIGVSNGKMTIIEGNYNNKVAKRTLSINAKYIRGFASPKYDVEPKEEAKPTPTPIVNKTPVQLACEVWQGVHGNGEARKKSLGKSYNDVQALVEKGVGKSKKSDVTSKALAQEVWDGLWGNGSVRKELLKQNGFDYSKVQMFVNRM